jgi:hypothetical protein
MLIFDQSVTLLFDPFAGVSIAEAPDFPQSTPILALVALFLLLILGARRYGNDVGLAKPDSDSKIRKYRRVGVRLPLSCLPGPEQGQ